MAKASLTLPDGTTVLVEGSPEEIQKIISLHRSSITQTAETKIEEKSTQRKPRQPARQDRELDLFELVNAFKSSDEAGLIERNILDRSGQVDRILLPLYIIHKHFSGSLGLNSTKIVKFLAELGITIFQSNVAKTLSSTASKYVMGDKLRKRGPGGVKYRLTRRGVQYLSSVIHEKTK